jgi:hypothetical protein
MTAGDEVDRIIDRIGRGVTAEQDEDAAWLSAVIAQGDPGPSPNGLVAAPDPLKVAVAAELTRRRARLEADRLLAAETASTITIPPAVRLDDFLALPDPPVAYRIDGVLPVGGRVLFAAQAKSGKTTGAVEAVRSLVDGYPFLDRFHVTPVRHVTLLDNEMNPAQLRRWLRDHDILNTDRVSVRCLRGQVHTFNITDDAILDRWVAELVGTDVLVVDCLRPILDAAGLDENFEAGRFLVALDRLAALARIGELILVHHMGHGAERSRGSSRLRDWPDVEWRLVRKTGDDDTVDGPRYFAAYGRDVDVPETALSYDPNTRRLTLTEGNRRAAERGATLEAVLLALADHPEGLSSNGIEKPLLDTGQQLRAIRDARQWAVRHGCIAVVDGPRKSRIHTLTTSLRRTATGASSQWCSECVTASIKDAVHSHSPAAVEDQPTLVAVAVDDEASE